MTTMRKREHGPEIVSQVVQQAIEASKPKARYLVAVPFANRVVLRLGDAARDGIFKRMFKIGLLLNKSHVEECPLSRAKVSKHPHKTKPASFSFFYRVILS